MDTTPFFTESLKHFFYACGGRLRGPIFACTGFMLSGLLLAAQPSQIRQLAITHSGAYDFYVFEGAPAGDSLYPYVTRMAQAGGHTYLLDGTFGPQFDAGTPGGAFLRQLEAATADGFVSQWRRESDTPLEIDNVSGDTLAAKAYDSLMVSPRNFVGYWFDESTGEIALTPDGIPEGINPENDPAGFQALVDEYVVAFNHFLERVPGATIHIYEFFPPASPFFPHTEDPSRDNTITRAHIDAFVAHALGRHQGWLDRLVTDIREHPQLDQSATLFTVPINRVLAELLRDHPELLVGRDWFDFARDGAPHFGDAGGSSDFFEAFMAPVLYGVLFRESVPPGFALEHGNLFASDFPMIADYIAAALNVDDSGGGGGTLNWVRWEDDSPDWSLVNGVIFDPTEDGLPAPDNQSVISLWSATSEATLQFEGGRIRLYGLSFPEAPSAEIYLNDTLVTTVDWSRASAAASTLLWESDAIAQDTVHQLRVRSTGDWVAIDYVEILTEQTGSGGSSGGEEPPPPDVTPVERPEVAGSYAFVVASDGSGDSTSIQAAVDAALPGDIIRVAAGNYAESVQIETANLTLLAEGTVHLTGGPNASFGLRIDADDVEVRGFTVSGILGYVFPGDHSATGFVINAARPRLIDCVAHGNGLHGFVVLPASEQALIDGGAAYNNTAGGIAVAGGRDTVIRNIDLYNTGIDGGEDGSYQASGIVSDNWGDHGGTPDNIVFLEDVQPINGLVIDRVTVRDHPDYGIRISARNEALSDFPSGRITTRNLQILNSHIHNNGSRLDDWVGGLYHLGGVLIQHVDGGSFANNLVENNYFWGIDAYRCHNMVYRDNRFLSNNRGHDTPGVTTEPVGMEINGGLNNRITRNLVYGSSAGVFCSWIPDSGDDTLFGPDSMVVEENVLFGNEGVDLELVVGPEGQSTRVIRNNFIGQVPAWHLDYLREDLGIDIAAENLLGSDPGFVDPANGDYTLRPDSPLLGRGWGPFHPRPEAPVRFMAWIFSHLGGNALESELALMADPDGDARANLLEYALGGRASRADPGLLPSPTPDPVAGRASMTLTLRGDDPQLQTTLLYSSDLSDWQPAQLSRTGGDWTSDAPSVRIEASEDLGGGLCRLTISLPMTEGALFLQLSADLIPAGDR